MKNRIESFVLNSTLAALMTLIIVGCNNSTLPTGSISPSRLADTAIDDTVITAAIKTALLANPEVSSVDLQVETRRGEVVLSGFVDSHVQIDRATAVAKNISGVKSVKNTMNLKAMPPAVSNTLDDSIVTTRVKSALLHDANITSHDITVLTRNGEVQLNGFVDNQQQIDRALERARGIEGVVAVNNEINIKK
jgi:hyperosmotically inducible periplasmic protein